MSFPLSRSTGVAMLLAVLVAACNSQKASPPLTTPLPPGKTVTATYTITPAPSPTFTPSPTPLPTLTPAPVISICSPLQNHPLSELPSLISWPFDPSPSTKHFGVDFSHWQLGDEKSSLDDPVQSALNGRVAGFINDRPPFGNMIVIETTYSSLPPALIEQLRIPQDQSVYHLYAHLADPPALTIGQNVACGQLLDRVGLTGWTVAPHLHFEIRWGPPGFTFTEMAYYTGDATANEMKNYETWFLSNQYQVFDPMILFSLPQP
jgi:hypothetical protein